MPKWDVRGPDGITYGGVEAPTLNDAIARMKAAHGVKTPATGPLAQPTPAPTPAQLPAPAADGGLIPKLRQGAGTAVRYGAPLVSSVLPFTKNPLVGGPIGAGSELAAEAIEGSPISGTKIGMSGAANMVGPLAGKAVTAWRGPEKVAKYIVSQWKTKVPAWSAISDSASGLTDIVWGKGQKLVSEAYDVALETVKRIGRGSTITIPLEDASKFGVQVSGHQAQVLGPPLARVDAGELAERMTGFWKKDPGAYRRAADALDAAGIGDPVSRGEYKAGQALIEYGKKSGMVKGGKMDVGAAKAGLTGKPVEELRRRGMGNVYEGPIAEATQGVRKIPGKPHPFVAGIGALEGARALMQGHTNIGVSALLASLLAGSMGKSFVSKPPTPDQVANVVNFLATLGTQGARAKLSQPRSTE